MSSHMNTVYFIAGASCAGKTTLSKKGRFICVTTNFKKKLSILSLDSKWQATIYKQKLSTVL